MISQDVDEVGIGDFNSCVSIQLLMDFDYSFNKSTNVQGKMY